MRRNLLLVAMLLLGGKIFSQSLDDVKKDIYYHKYISAKKALNAMIAGGNPAPEAYYWLSEVYLQDDDMDSAKMVMQKGMDAVKDQKKAMKAHPLVFAGWGHILLNEGKQQEARTLFDQVVDETKGKDAEALWGIARANIDSKKGDNNFAIEVLNKAIERDEKNVNLYLAMGDVYRKMIDGSNAVKYYMRALEVDPFKAEAYHKMGMIYRTQNNVSVYVDRFSKAIGVDSTYAPTYYELYYHYYFRDVDMARDNLEKYFRFADPSPEFDYMMTDLLYVSRKYNEAIDKAQSILTRDGEKAKPRLFKLISYSYESLGDSAKALDYVNKYFDKEKEENLVSKDFQLKGELLYKYAHKYDEAEQYYAKAVDYAKKEMAAEEAKKEEYQNKDAIQRNKDDIEKYLETLAAIDKAAGNRAGQAKWMEELVKFKPDPTNLDIYNLGMAFYGAQEYPKADSVFAIYEDKYPDQIYGYLWRARCNALIDTSMEQGLAIPHYKKLIEFAEQDSAKYRVQLISAYGYVGAYEANVVKDYPTSLQYFDKILSLDEGNADAMRYKEILSKWIEEGKGVNNGKDTSSTATKDAGTQ